MFPSIPLLIELAYKQPTSLFKPWALPFTRLPLALPKQLLVTTRLTCPTRGPDQPLQRPDC